MANITITIPDNDTNRLLAAFDAETLDDAKTSIVAWITEQVRWHEVKQAEAEALANAASTVTEIVLS